MKKEKCLILLLAFLFATVSVASFSLGQEYNLDIKFDQANYSIGNNITYSVILLDANSPLNQQVSIVFSDALDKKIINKTVNTNEDNFLFVENDFSSGAWKATAYYETKTVKRIFIINENEGISFSIVEDKLIITNNGNVPYRKQIQIIIGEEIITQNVNIDIGKSKEIQLVAPDGNYDVQVSDGKTKMSKPGVHLTSTGNVIGAINQDIQSGSPLSSSVRNVNQSNYFSLFPSDKTLISFVFIGAVFGLGLLLLMSRIIEKRRRLKVNII